MNGISAVALATGNDTRAIEAGAHAYAARSGTYSALSRWEVTAQGDLTGSLEMPLSVGTVGGATKTHPIARIAIRILGVEKAEALARTMAAVGLAQNFAALRALATTGIQEGHMRLHAYNVAIAAGATGKAVDVIAAKLQETGEIREDVARRLLQEIDVDAGPTG